MMDLTKTLFALSEQLTAEEHQWLTDELSALKTSQDPINSLLNSSVIVKRKISSQINLNTQALTHYENHEIIRLTLLKATFDYHPSDFTKINLKAYYQAGDSSEKCAFLKGLSLIDEQGIGVNLAINAGRCNSVDEFSALALLNPYPAKHFPELNFNQTVLKALFLGLEIDTIINLNERANSALSNMCFSYAVEQALAARIPPASLWLAVNYAHLNDENKQLFNQYAQHFYSASSAHQLSLEQLIKTNNVPNFLA